MKDIDDIVAERDSMYINGQKHMFGGSRYEDDGDDYGDDDDAVHVYLSHVDPDNNYWVGAVPIDIFEKYFRKVGKAWDESF